MSAKQSEYGQRLAVFLGAAFLFLPWGGQVPLFDWDEINFAESAREMLITGDFFRVTVNFEPFWEKPPLFIWLQALSMYIFGVGEMAARLPNALASMATLTFIHYIGSKHMSTRVGMAWVWAYLASIFPHFYFNTGLIDPVFNLFIFIGVYHLFRGLSPYRPGKNLRFFLIAGVFTGLAILTKGPVALLLSLLVFVFFLVFHSNQIRLNNVLQLFVYLITTGAIATLWFLPEWIANGPWFIKEFVLYQIQLASQDVAGHAQPFYYHALVLLAGCFPASVLALTRIAKPDSHNVAQKQFIRLMQILFWIVLIVFSSVKTKIVHYSSLCWLPLTFFAAHTYTRLTQSYSSSMPRWNLFLFILLSLVWFVVLSLIPLIIHFDSLKSYLISHIQDPFVVANLRAPVQGNGWEWILPCFLLVVLGLSVFWIATKRYRKGFKLLALGLTLFIPIYSVWVVPKAERFIQGTLIDFYKELSGRDVYIKTMEKSYAPYFYAQVTPLDSSDGWWIAKNEWLESQGLQTHLSAEQRRELNRFQIRWLLEGPIDKDAYLVIKTHKLRKMPELYELEKVHEMGGYSVFKRPAQ